MGRIDQSLSLNQLHPNELTPSLSLILLLRKRWTASLLLSTITHQRVANQLLASRNLFKWDNNTASDDITGQSGLGMTTKTPIKPKRIVKRSRFFSRNDPLCMLSGLLPQNKNHLTKHFHFCKHYLALRIMIVTITQSIKEDVLHILQTPSWFSQQKAKDSVVKGAERLIMNCPTNYFCVWRQRPAPPAYNKQVNKSYGDPIYMWSEKLLHTWITHNWYSVASTMHVQTTYCLVSALIQKCFDCDIYLCNTRYQADAYNYEPLSLCVYLCVFVCVCAFVRVCAVV